MARREQVLYRDNEDKMIGGVCSGLGHYFDVDTTLVRVVFVVLTLLGGGGLLGYVMLWAVLNPAPLGYWAEAFDLAVAGEMSEGPEIEVVNLTGLESVDTAS